MRHVFIEEIRLISMITSAIEVYNRETNGCLIGKNTVKEVKGRKVKVVSIKGIYPFQTEKRTPSQVMHGNMSAFKRTINSLKSMESEIVGGYHSHPYPYPHIRLSKDDVVSIKEEMEMMKKLGYKSMENQWLEVLLSIKEVEHKKEQEIGWTIINYKKKKSVKCMVRTDFHTRYDIIITAYWIRYPESADSKSKPTVREANVYVPWLI